MQPLVCNSMQCLFVLFSLFHMFWKYFIQGFFVHERNCRWNFYVFSEELILGVFLEIIVVIFLVKMFSCHFKFESGWIVFCLEERILIILVWIKILPLMSLYIIISCEAVLIMQNSEAATRVVFLRIFRNF